MPTDSTESVFVGVDTHADTPHVTSWEIWAAIWMTGSSRPIRAATVASWTGCAPLDRWPLLASKALGPTAPSLRGCSPQRVWWSSRSTGPTIAAALN